MPSRWLRVLVRVCRVAVQEHELHAAYFAAGFSHRQPADWLLLIDRNAVTMSAPTIATCIRHVVGGLSCCRHSDCNATVVQVIGHLNELW